MVNQANYSYLGSTFHISTTFFQVTIQQSWKHDSTPWSTPAFENRKRVQHYERNLRERVLTSN